ncbi:LicD family protein [Paludicola sp. MB14-C6]|uniref:LicD family protein n=1 Tax=Paludihabitans sp. MB14-C6 TaxID=3070656 RepID=UPI0027DCED73|nr:LicD family protein [Paludicola sp. MB14-C6]WMJ23073.1 LicD family protein [Paludicola sp. MB14-C6]
MKKEQLSQFEGISLKEMQQLLLDDLKAFHKACEELNCRYCLTFGSLLGAVRHDGFIPWDDDVDVYMPREDYIRFMKYGEEKLGKNYFIQTAQTDKHYKILHIPAKIRSNSSTLIEEWNVKYHQGSFIDIFTLDYIGNDEKDFTKIHKKCAFLQSLKMRISFKELSGIKKYIRIALQLIFKLIPAKAIDSYIQKQVAKFSDNKTSFNGRIYDGIDSIQKDSFDEKDIFPLKLHKFEDCELYVPNHPENILPVWYSNYNELPSEEQRIPHGYFYSDRNYKEFI